MKKLLASLFVLGLIITGTSAFALNHNMSIEYTRTMNRSAAIADDSCYFNPAGTAFLKDGLYIGVGNQIVYRTQTITEAKNNSYADAGLIDNEYEGVIFAPVYPNLGITFKTGSIAAFWHTGVYGGGGGGTYDSGIPLFAMMYKGAAIANLSALDPTTGAILLAPTTSIDSVDADINFEGSEFKVGTQLGAAYAINEMMSVALAGRMYYLMQTITGSAKNLDLSLTNYAVGTEATVEGALGTIDVDLEYSGIGFGGVFGFDVKPMKDLNIAINVQYNFKMQKELKVNKIEATNPLIEGSIEGMFPDGNKEVVTEPMEAWLGVEYTVLPNLIVAASFGYVFETLTDYDADNDAGVDEGENSDDIYQNKIIGGIGVEYKAMKELTVSVGYLYDGCNKKEAGQSEMDWSTTTNYISGGATYAIMPELDVTLSCTYAIHSKESNSEVIDQTQMSEGYMALKTQEYTRDTISFGLGVNYRMPMGGAAASDEAIPVKEEAAEEATE